MTRALHLKVETIRIVEALEEGAQRRRWLIAAAEAREAGLSAATVGHVVEIGRWVRIARGVYAVAGRPGGILQPTAAALRAAGPRAFAQRRAAAAAHGGLDIGFDGAPDIAVPRPGSGSVPRRKVPERHLVERRGIRCTDPLLTLLDLAGVLDPILWEHALEAALRERLTSIEAIQVALAAPGRRNPLAVRTVRSVLHARPHLAPATGSVLETRFVQLVRRAGLPEPDRQVEVRVSDRVRYFLDLAWPEFGVFVELDGEHHLGQPVHDADRETAVVGATGWLPARFTWTQVVGSPATAIRRLQAVLAQASRRPMTA